MSGAFDSAYSTAYDVLVPAPPPPPPPPPVPVPEGALAWCLDCGQWLWMTEWSWADQYGAEICLHRRVQEHVPASADSFGAVL